MVLVRFDSPAFGAFSSSSLAGWMPRFLLLGFVASVAIARLSASMTLFLLGLERLLAELGVGAAGVAIVRALIKRVDALLAGFSGATSLGESAPFWRRFGTPMLLKEMVC